MRGALRDARLRVRRVPEGWSLEDASSSCQRLLGADPETMLRAFADDISPLFAEAEREAVAASLSAAAVGAPATLDDVALDLSAVGGGDELLVRAEFVPETPEEGGDAVTVVLSASAAGRSQRSAQGRAALFQLLSDVTDGVVRVDEDLRILEASAGFAALVGAPGTEGDSLSRYLSHADEALLAEELLNCQASLGSFRGQVQLVTAGGDPVPVSVRGTREGAGSAGASFCICFAQQSKAEARMAGALAAEPAAKLADAEVALPAKAGAGDGDESEPSTPRSSPRLAMRKLAMPTFSTEAALATVDAAAKQIESARAVSPPSPRSMGRTYRVSG